MRIYLTHDIDDVGLVNSLADLLNLMKFEVFVSPFDLLGKIPKLDTSLKVEIKNCDVLVALFAKVGLRSTLVKREIGVARSENKPVLPFKEQHSRCTKLGKITQE